MGSHANVGLASFFKCPSSCALALSWDVNTASHCWASTTGKGSTLLDSGDALFVFPCYLTEHVLFNFFFHSAPIWHMGIKFISQDSEDFWVSWSVSCHLSPGSLPHSDFLDTPSTHAQLQFSSHAKSIIRDEYGASCFAEPRFACCVAM